MGSRTPLGKGIAGGRPLPEKGRTTGRRVAGGGPSSEKRLRRGRKRCDQEVGRGEREVRRLDPTSARNAVNQGGREREGGGGEGGREREGERETYWSNKG